MSGQAAAADKSADKTGAAASRRLAPRVVIAGGSSIGVEDELPETYCVRFSPDDRLVAAAAGDGTVRVYSSNSGKLSFTLRNTELYPLPTTCVRWRPASAQHKTKNILIAANSDGTVRHWHVTSEKNVHTIKEEGNEVYAVDYRPDAEQFATAGKDYQARTHAPTISPTQPHQPQQAAVYRSVSLLRTSVSDG
eukprot:TRINITY_DN134_c0_g1_i3.p1 TRINITY_DN134_c0_g1~~TRINITY_DN134_c0_g1_i3.p1  ORF type:complete len:193 (+),score=51.61 TRINITY_DN134_c0_g1_i3:88-666(+)